MGIYLDRDLRRTQFVLAVARELHFGKAAARLNIAQSYLSREVKEFEDEQGYLFFERNGHYVAAVTDSGQAFIRTMAPVLDDLRAGFERASEMGRMISRQKAGSFLIGYSPLVPGAISEQVRSIRSMRFPVLRLQFRTLTPTELFDSLASGGLQAAVTYAFSGRRDLEQIPIGSQRLHAVYPRNQNENRTTTVGLHDLRSHSLVVPSSERMQPEIRDWLLEQCERAGFRPKIVEEPTSTREAFDLVKDHAGLGVMPGGICDGMTEKLESSPILGIGELQLVLAYKRKCSPRIQRIATEFAHALRQSCLKTGS
jgi:DNA-binding transcriptional LysR family regulator